MTANRPLEIKRLEYRLVPDSSRVIARFFCPGDETRITAILQRVCSLDGQQVERLLAKLESDFSTKHHDMEDILLEHYEAVREHVPAGTALDRRHQLLIGAYFTMEYALESAALFNPSMVPSFDQSGLPTGSTRFMMSLRATGEGHISSIVFRRGTIDADCNIHMDPASPFSRQLEKIENRDFVKETYRLKLIEMGAYSELADAVLDRLGEQFTLRELSAAIERARGSLENAVTLQEAAENMLSLARSNYHLQLPAGMDPSEVVIFPSSENESNGIEDVRLVRFADDDGEYTYYGTYTAYNGFRIFPQLLEITPGQLVKVHTLSGLYAQNKGMALFPRKVDGWYLMISRLDNENLYLMKSDNVRFWNQADLLQAPKFPWEFIQIGNCGSPLETEAGWLLLTHGVGPMRQYCMGATLLDLEDPSRVLGQMSEPLLAPIEDERDGYVPNVVYSCGAMIHHDTLIIPYAVSDFATTFATVSLDALLETLTRC